MRKYNSFQDYYRVTRRNRSEKQKINVTYIYVNDSDTKDDLKTLRAVEKDRGSIATFFKVGVDDFSEIGQTFYIEKLPVVVVYGSLGLEAVVYDITEDEIKKHIDNSKRDTERHYEIVRINGNIEYIAKRLTKKLFIDNSCFSIELTDWDKPGDIIKAILVYNDGIRKTKTVIEGIEREYSQYGEVLDYFMESIKERYKHDIYVGENFRDDV